jgi:hypothetical protein
MNRAACRGRDRRLATTGMMTAPAIRCAAARVSLVEIAVSAAVAGTWAVGLWQMGALGPRLVAWEPFLVMGGMGSARNRSSGAFPKKSLPLVFGLMMEQGDPAVIKDILDDAPLPVRLLMPVIGPPIATAHNKRLRRAVTG